MLLRAPHRPLGMLLCSCSLVVFAGGSKATSSAPRGESGRRSVHGGPLSASTWRRPEAGRLKLNFDGSCRHASGRQTSASIGGVYRDHEGTFVLGYAERIGEATSSVAELAALRRGLELALENGWSGIWVEGDALAAIDVVRRRARVRSEEDRRQCREIDALLPLLGGVDDDDDIDGKALVVSHVRRKGNRVAHGFARLGHGAVQPRVWRDVPPAKVVRDLRRDLEGKK